MYLELSNINSRMSSAAKHYLFNLFSDDLKKTLKDCQLKLSHRQFPIPDTLYLCPISLNYFAEGSLESGELTLEHVPPQSLGGKGKLLTCRQANNLDGQSTDKRLLNYFRGLNFEINEGKIEGEISSAALGITRIRTELVIGTSEAPKFQFIASKKNLEALKYKKLFENWDGTSFNIKWNIQKAIDKRALLKCAYLCAFRFVGYHLLFRKKAFREETYGMLVAYLRSTDDAVDFPVPFFSGHFSADCPAVGLVAAPEEYLALYVQLEFKLAGQFFKFTVFLPHPDETSLAKLASLNGLMENGRIKGTTDLRITEIPEVFRLAAEKC